jgi:hypothetical protein
MAGKWALRRGRRRVGSVAGGECGKRAASSVCGVPAPAGVAGALTSAK